MFDELLELRGTTRPGIVGSVPITVVRDYGDPRVSASSAVFQDEWIRVSIGLVLRRKSRVTGRNGGKLRRGARSVMNDCENPMLSLSFRVTAIYAGLPPRSRIGYQRELMSRKIVTFNKYPRVDAGPRDARWFLMFPTRRNQLRFRVCVGLDSYILLRHS